MSLIHDRRGQSVVIGAVVLFGFLIVALAVYQAFGVPAQNAEIEVDHNEDLQSDMTDLRNTLLDTRTRTDLDRTAAHRSVQIRLGTRYPSRILTVNPPPATGTLQSQDDVPNLTLDSARLADSRYTNVDPVLDQSHETSLLTYTPGYNEYREAPRTTFEHSLLYNQFEGANLTLTGQRTVDGDARELDIVVYDGDVNEQGLRTTVDPATLDGPSVRVPIEGDDGNITLTLPTESPEVWEEVIDDEQNAEVIDSDSDTVTIELDDGDVWDLRMTRVGVDGGEADDLFSNVEAPDEDETDELNRTFRTEWTTSEPATVAAGGSRDLTVRTTDRETGDPIVDSTVDASYAVVDAEGDGPDTIEADGRTDPDGQTTVEFDASNAEEGDQFRVYASSGDDVDRLLVDVIEPDALGFNQVTASDLDANTDGQTQEFTFQVSGDLPEGETVDIDLDDAQQRGGGGRNFQVDYRSATGSSDDGDVTVSATNTEANVEFTSPEGGVEDGETAVITVENVATGPNGQQNDPYTVTFTRNDSGASEETTFEVD